MQIDSVVIIKHDAIGWEDFTQQVAITVEVKELPKLFKHGRMGKATEP